FPLIGGDADRQLGIARVLHHEDDFGGRNRHHHEDHDRNDGPDDLHLRAVHHGGVGYGALRVAKFHQGVNHHSEYRDGDADADPEYFHVQGVDVVAQAGDTQR